MQAKEAKGPGRRGQQTRERILEVAEELIARHGVEAFELKEVAARVGIRSPSIFAHFKGREDLAECVSRRVGETIVAQFAATATGDPLEYRVDVTLAWQAGGVRRARTFTTLLLREIPFGERMRRLFVEQEERQHRILNERNP